MIALAPLTAADLPGAAELERQLDSSRAEFLAAASGRAKHARRTARAGRRPPLTSRAKNTA